MIRTRRSTALAWASLALVSAVALAGCTADDAGPEPSTERPTPTAAPAEPPALLPDGTAGDNLPYFDHVNTEVVAANEGAKGRDFVDALVAAGFDKGAMQVTADATTIGDAADSVLFSVQWGEECLIGQFGASSEGYHSAVQPKLGTGGCLIGATRPIDW